MRINRAVQRRLEALRERFGRGDDDLMLRIGFAVFIAPDDGDDCDYSVGENFMQAEISPLRPPLRLSLAALRRIAARELGANDGDLNHCVVLWARQRLEMETEHE